MEFDVELSGPDGALIRTSGRLNLVSAAKAAVDVLTYERHNGENFWSLSRTRAPARAKLGAPGQSWRKGYDMHSRDFWGTSNGADHG